MIQFDDRCYTFEIFVLKRAKAEFSLFLDNMWITMINLWITN